MDTPFNERGVTLSRAGLSASGQMIPLRDLRAARVVMIPRQKPLPVIIALLGLVALGAGIITGSGEPFRASTWSLSISALMTKAVPVSL